MTGQRAPLVSVVLISSAALAYEILLMRLFSIVQWHHFAYMIISLALLGFGASGTFISLARNTVAARFELLYLGSATLFAVSSLVCFLVASRVPFYPEAMLFDPAQWIILVTTYLLLALPFFFAANVIGLAFTRFPSNITYIYAGDLIGAGAGSVGVILLLFLVLPMTALKLIATLGFLAAAAAAYELRLGSRIAAAAGVLATALWLLPASLQTLQVSQYKGLSQALRIPGTSVEMESSSPLGLVTALSSRQVPLRHAPGLSLAADVEPPEQIGLFTDADNMSVINRFDGSATGLGYLDQLTTALPYHLSSPRNVLVLGAGGGTDVLQALTNDVEHVDAVELNPDIVRLLQEQYGEFSGRIYDNARVDVHVAEARGFVARSETLYDLMIISLLDAYGASAAGLYALSENYLYTVEALEQYVSALAPGGILAVSRWVKMPPRDTLKLFATAVAALRKAGIDDPGEHMVLIRGWQTSTLLIRRGTFSQADIATLRSFSEQRLFDLAWYPGMQAEEANRYNVLRQPLFHEAARALVGPESGSFLDAYKFNINPATDDAPYFFHFFRWRVLPEILSLRGQGGLPLLEGGYLVLIAILVQAIIAGAVFVLLPVMLPVGRRLSPSHGMSRIRVFSYFSLLGLAFLFLEIAFMQKLILFLSHPLYAAAVALTAFLVFAGLGSACGRWLTRRFRASLVVRTATLGIAALSLLYHVVLDSLLTPWLATPDAVRIALTVLLIAPLAWLMGLPFPLALTRLGEQARELVPWAWAINGCASVVGVVLATLIAIHFGLGVVVILAALMYALAGRLFPIGTPVAGRRQVGALVT
ncbi:MAG: SAM-dependent methyltransferase [Gammaproteobacteria bacterium]